MRRYKWILIRPGLWGARPIVRKRNLEEIRRLEKTKQTICDRLELAQSVNYRGLIYKWHKRLRIILSGIKCYE